jgi:hypothetical protein
LIPNAYIQAWRASAPWPDARQVEQDLMRAFERVWRELIARLRGDAWKLTDKALDELRSKKYPNLLRG